MSHHVTTPVLACFYGSGNLMLLAIALADACPDASGKDIYKSVARLAHESRTSVRTTQGALKRLQAHGWLVRDSAGNGGRGHATRYRISADWLARARQEIADASLQNRSPALVGPSNIKGAELAPFAPVDNYPQTPQKSTVNPAEKRLKGAAAAAGEQRTEYLNTPLPPESGGVRDFEKLESEYPRHDMADRVAAHRVWTSLAPDAVRMGMMLTVLRALKASPRWQSDEGRWVPRLSRWLRGWLVGDGPPLPDVAAPPPTPPPLPPRVVLSPEQLAANKSKARAARELMRELLARDKMPNGASVARKFEQARAVA